ncbi:MAG TPA: YceD family protein [Acidocella sp.]|jgi:hypothetical protein|nr:YceD family protein [Acidocella sp.]
MNSEFSKPVKAGHIHGEPQHFTLEAGEEARAALARRFSLPNIAQLSGQFTLRHERGGVISAQLVMRARVTQLCVITNEPFEVDIAEQAELRFVPAESLTEEEDFGPDSLAAPDEIPYENDVIDLGEALAEQLALALDPYPRKPGAVLPGEATDDETGPFAALKGKFGKLS